MLTVDMANAAKAALQGGIESLTAYTPELEQQVRALEDKTDHYEDILGTYLVKLSTLSISEAESAEAAGLLKLIGDYERIGDHATDLLHAGRELSEKQLSFSGNAHKELTVILNAVTEVMDLATDAFIHNDLEKARSVEPLEQVVDKLRTVLRSRHIMRLQQGACSIEAGFVWADLLTGLERTSDHCSNIAACIIDMKHHTMNLHESTRNAKAAGEEFDREYQKYLVKYALPQA